MKQRKTTQPGDPDAETRALWEHLKFQALLAEGRASGLQGSISPEGLDRRRPLTAEDRALADEYAGALDRLEAEQDAEVTAEQANLLNVVLIAAHYLRREPPKTLDEWEKYTGLREVEIRAAAMALKTVGLKTTQPPKAGIRREE